MSGVGSLSAPYFVKQEIMTKKRIKILEHIFLMYTSSYYRNRLTFYSANDFEIEIRKALKEQGLNVHLLGIGQDTLKLQIQLNTHENVD